MDNRTSKQNYYLDIADAVLERSTCLRRKYGAIIVCNDEIISTGYNGAPRGRRNCSDYERLILARDMARDLCAYIILKGHYSALCLPDGGILFNTTGNAGMATAGSGDVLTGIITALLARGYSRKNACLVGMYLHGLAGDIAAERTGKESLIASDIIDSLPEAFKNNQQMRTPAGDAEAHLPAQRQNPVIDAVQADATATTLCMVKTLAIVCASQKNSNTVSCSSDT